MNVVERYNGLLAVSRTTLIRNDDGEAITSIPEYKHLVSRKQVNVLRQGKGAGNYALIEYASLPERFKVRFEAKYGNPEEIMRKELEAARTFLPQDIAAQQFFATYRLPDGKYIQEEFQDEYVLNARVLNVLADAANTQRVQHNSKNNSTPVQWSNIVKICEEYRSAYHHTLPKSEGRLRGKMREYAREGYACLVSGKLGNSNTLKVTKEAERWVIAMRRSKTPVYTVGQILEEYNRIAPKKGWKALKSESTLNQILNRPDIMPQWYDAVYGELAAKQLFSRRNKTKMPTMRDSLWYGDGTKLNLFYKAYEGGKLVVKTAYVYEVIDAFNDTLLGYAVGRTENFDLQYRAFRMAVETSGHKPYEIVTDNQGGQKKKALQEFFSSITSHVGRTTAPYNPQSKSIESVFGRFQRQVLHKDWRFTGGNISSKGSWKIDREFIEANKEKLYTYGELLDAYAKARGEWNAMDGRMDAYLASVNPGTEAVSDIDMVNLFWIQTARSVKYTADGITVQFQNRKRTFEVYTAEGLPDYEWGMSNTGKSFVVKFDPLTMDTALLFEETASGIRFVTAAYPYLEVQRNIQEQGEGDMALIRMNDRANKKIRVQRQIEAKALEMEFGVAPEQHGLKTPALKGISEAEFDELADELYAAASPEPAAEPVSVGEYTKALSNMDYDPNSALNRL